MIPVEYVSLMLVAAFGAVGLSRKFPRELGATVAYVAMLFTLVLVGDRLTKLVYSIVRRGGPGAEPDLHLVQWFVTMAFIAGWVVVIYAGQTFTFVGKWPPHRVTGVMFDGLAGLLNGWIVVWTAWECTHRLGYPHVALGWFVPPLSDRAAQWVELAPLALIPDGRETWVLGGILAFLIFLRVAR